MPFKKGHIPWNKGTHITTSGSFTKGHIPWNKNITGYSTSWKGRNHTKVAKKKMSVAHKGQHLSDRTKQNISETMKRLYAEGKIISPMKGKHHSEKTKQKISEALRGTPSHHQGVSYEKEYGIVRAKLIKEKMSRALMGRTSPMKGKYASKGTKRKMSEAHRGLLHTDVTKRKISEGNRGKRLSEETRQKIREARLKRVFPKKDTIIEVLMQNELKRRGIAFKTHVPLCGICQPDIVIPEKRIVIQCDGDYWHNLPSYHERDAEQNKVLRADGWKVHRFWEHEINKDVEACITQVIKELG